MSSIMPNWLYSLPVELRSCIFYQNLSIITLSQLRKTSKYLELEIDEFVRHQLILLKIHGPSTIQNFLTTHKESVTLNNSWAILAQFKKAYPFLPLHVSIEKGCQQLDQATFALKDALILQSPQNFAGLRLQQTAQEIRDWFANPINHPLLKTITKLDLSGRGLSLVPQELCFLSNLRNLYLNRNEIVEITDQTFPNLPKLRNLYLCQNQIAAIAPHAFLNLPALQGLLLNQNQITAIHPQTFANLINLQSLDLSKNEISSIVLDSFMGLAALKWLHLSENKITAIEDQSFYNLENLESIDLTDNQISTPDCINHAYLGLQPNVTIFILRDGIS